MSDDERSHEAEEVKRRVMLWVFTALSGIAGTIGLSLGYWMVSIAIEARDHAKTQHFTRMEHLEYDREVKARFVELERMIKEQ